MEKVCTECHLLLTTDKFHKDRKSRNGLRSKCKLCIAGKCGKGEIKNKEKGKKEINKLFKLFKNSAHNNPQDKAERQKIVDEIELKISEANYDPPPIAIPKCLMKDKEWLVNEIQCRLEDIRQPIDVDIMGNYLKIHVGDPEVFDRINRHVLKMGNYIKENKGCYDFEILMDKAADSIEKR